MIFSKLNTSSNKSYIFKKFLIVKKGIVLITFSKILSEIKLSIPQEILEIGFKEYDSDIPLSIDSLILEKVIKPYLIPDMDVYSHEVANTIIHREEFLSISPNGFIFKIKNDLLNGREVIKINSVVAQPIHDYPIHIHPYEYSSNRMHTKSEHLNEIANKIDKNHLSGVLEQSAITRRVGKNVFEVTEINPTYFEYNINMVVTNDLELNNINIRFFNDVSELAVLMVKRYIYNFLKVKLSKGYLYLGHELTGVKDVVDDYREAENEYKEKLKEWKKKSFVQNPKNVDTLIKLQYM
jgi:hypothetical protein